MSSPGRFKRPLFILTLLLAAVVPLFFLLEHNSHASATGLSTHLDAATQHYEYVFPDGSMYVYDIDNGYKLVKQISLPTTDVRGVVASAATGMLYISYGGNGGVHGNGSLLKYNLLTDSIVWTQNYNFGIDSMGISPDGKTIYMPNGSAQYDANGIWYVIDASNGNVTGSITAGESAHNTLVSLNGKHVYMGGIYNNYLQVADTSINQVIEKIGPLKDGVRPFTINGTETLAFTTASGFLGFQVSSITTGQVLYTVPIQGFSAPAGTPAPSHGISLSPDEKEIYVMDYTNDYVHVFDVSGLPATAPKQVADIHLSRPMGGSETPCTYDCTQEGWLQHSRDGRFVYVGDTGDVIDTATRQIVANMPAMVNTRKFLEIGWANGVPVFATPRLGIGYVTSVGPQPSPTPVTPTPAPTITPTPTPRPGSVIAKDTFNRANQTYWGTSSDGHRWGGDANSFTVFSIVNNTGKVSGGNTYYNATLGPIVSNAEVFFTGSISSFSGSNIGAVLRWNDTNDFYKAYIDGTNLVLQSKVNGNYTTLGSVAFAAKGGTGYALRFRIVGTTLYAKVWPKGTTEPASWMITATDSSLQSGYCGLRLQTASGTTGTYSYFQATNR